MKKIFNAIKEFFNPGNLQVQVSKESIREDGEVRLQKPAQKPKVTSSPYSKKKTVLTVEFCSQLAKDNREKRIAKYPETVGFGQIQADLSVTPKRSRARTKPTVGSTVTS